MKITREYLDQLADRIELATNNYRVPCAVIGGRVLPSHIAISLLPQTASRIAGVRNALPDIARYIGVKAIRMTTELNVITFQIDIEDRRVIKLAHLWKRADASSPFSMSSAPLGISETGAYVVIDMSKPEMCHALIAGITGSGKTTLGTSLLASLARRRTRAEAMFVIVDPKGIDPVRESHTAPLLLTHLAQTPAQALHAINDAVGAITTRMKAGRGARMLPRIYVYVDELSDILVSSEGDLIQTLLTRIVSVGREYGVHLIASTQKPLAEAIGTMLRANFPLRIVGRVSTAEESRLAAGRAGVGAELLTGTGEFIAVSGSNTTRFTAALPSPGQANITAEAILFPDDPGEVAPQDSVAGFIEARVQRVGTTGAAALYAAYTDWCVLNDETPVAQTIFGARMAETFTRRHTRDGKVYEGCSLIAEAQ